MEKLRRLLPSIGEATGIVLVCAILVTLGIVQYKEKCECGPEPNGERHEMRRWDCRFLDDPNAVFTAAGVVAVILGFWYVRRQLDQGQKSLDLATESLRAYLRVESGRLVFEKFDWGPNALGFNAYFRNVGRSTLAVRGFTIDFDQATNGDPLKYEPPGGFTEFVDEGAKFVAGYAPEAPLFTAKEVPSDLIEMVREAKKHGIVLTVLYDTLGAGYVELRVMLDAFPLPEGGFQCWATWHQELPMGLDLARALLWGTEAEGDKEKT